MHTARQEYRHGITLCKIQKFQTFREGFSKRLAGMLFFAIYNFLNDEFRPGAASRIERVSPHRSSRSSFHTLWHNWCCDGIKYFELELWSTPIQLDTRRRIRLGKVGDDKLDGCSTDGMLGTSLGSSTIGGYLWFFYSVIPFTRGYSLSIGVLTVHFLFQVRIMSFSTISFPSKAWYS